MTEPQRRRRIALLAAGGVALAVGLSAVIYGPTAWRIFQEGDAVLTTPDTVAGLRLDDSDQATETADYLRTALAADLGLDNPVGAVYTDGRSVILVGGTGRLRAPDKDLERGFGLLSDDTSRVEDIRSVAPGALGGTMKCGLMAGEDTLTVCGWADHGSLAIAMFSGRGVDEAAGLLRSMRDAILRRE